VNALLHHTEDLSAGFDQQRPGIVHRLDRDTSGILVVAKTEVAQISLSSQFKARTTKRTYWAVVYGVPKEKSGKIESFLARHPSERKRFASTTKGGKKAITHFQVLKSQPSKETSLVELKLETGRTHQIRVHLSELGHPIVGDTLYSKPSRLKTLKSVQLRNEIENLPRFLLHACELGFNHPITNEFMSFKTDWPAEVLPLLMQLGYREK
jgi:23S rRNA pseudouridine1911/1915/1917 synthase